MTLWPWTNPYSLIFGCLRWNYRDNKSCPTHPLNVAVGIKLNTAYKSALWAARIINPDNVFSAFARSHMHHLPRTMTQPVRSVPELVPLYNRWGNWAWKRLSDLPSVSEPAWLPGSQTRHTNSTVTGSTHSTWQGQRRQQPPNECWKAGPRLPAGLVTPCVCPQCSRQGVSAEEGRLLPPSTLYPDKLGQVASSS